MSIQLLWTLVPSIDEITHLAAECFELDFSLEVECRCYRSMDEDDDGSDRHNFVIRWHPP